MTAKRSGRAVKRARRFVATRTVPRPGAPPSAGRGGGGFRAFVATDTPPATKIDVIRTGVGARVVEDMVGYLEVPKNVVFALLHTPESTAHRLIKEGRTLDSSASERVMRVADVTR